MPTAKTIIDKGIEISYKKLNNNQSEKIFLFDGYKYKLSFTNGKIVSAIDLKRRTRISLE